MSEENLNITVIGASRGLGKWIAEKLADDGYNVKITSRDKKYGKNVAKQIGAGYDHDNINAVREADIIIFSVPIEYMVSTIKQVAPHAPKGCLLMDITSVKKDVSKALNDYAPPECEILPCHPMFGPRLPSIEGQVIILTPIEGRCNSWYDRITGYLKANHTHIVIASPEEHDKTMSVVQGLTHFSYISIASTIMKLGINIKKSREFASPVYSMMLDMISRIVSQNPYLYYSIQKSNDLTSMARKTLIEESIRLSKYIDDGDADSFISNMAQSAKHLDDVREATGRSDKAISVLTYELNYLSKSIGKEVALMHQYSHRVHIGIVKEVDSEHVTIEEKSKDVTLKLSNVVILFGEALYEWKKNNLKQHSFDVSVELDKNANKEIILDLLNRLDEVITVRLIDEYHGRQIAEDKVSLTFNYTTFNRNDKDKVEKYLEGIGGKIR